MLKFGLGVSELEEVGAMLQIISMKPRHPWVHLALPCAYAACFLSRAVPKLGSAQAVRKSLQLGVPVFSRKSKHTCVSCVVLPRARGWWVGGRVSLGSNVSVRVCVHPLGSIIVKVWGGIS